MYQLLYISKVTQLDSIEQQIEKILSSSHRNNQADQITGILLYRSGYFMQLLEGSKEKVLNCFNRICDDSRHQGVHLLFTSQNEQRIFDQWSMGYKDLSDLGSQQFMELVPESIYENIRSGLTGVDNEKILKTIKKFREDL